jgi:hypothetical protein
VRFASRLGWLVVAASIAGCSSAADQSRSSKASNPPVTSAASSQTITVQRLILVDKDGKERAELGVVPGGAGLALTDAAGKARGAFVVTDDGSPGLTLYDADGVARATIQVSNNGESGVSLYDDTGVHRLSAIVNANGAAGVVFYDKTGKQIAAAPVISHRPSQKPSQPSSK